ncbi:hypothetical protein [Paenibacillus macquariensis]|uniref:Uncharacterized protein n=1 Tax=Paenibacillus macquariensis TaxID=948756 RepID=A0ABY1JKA2_9BACL|nr:hypothetical protein [Paenibacillus macquariensis]MEC0089885.1 hypothetical protein [Paenibacillus macquariensis]OAB30654.1 hypothetical protein PMSM_21115 [Paenibacillus macquariensis subsp. macquariensis]SIQ33559.1 hypothetical protein SAMN05421578_101269 [Paenibacillus macquariensis]
MDKTLFDNLLKIFVEEVKQEFDSTFQKKIKRIFEDSMIRGNNSSLSHVVEDKFAEFLNNLNIKSNYLFLIDVNLSTMLNGVKKSIRPDIVVIHRDSKKIIAIFELKIDDARASDTWVEDSNGKLKLLKDINNNSKMNAKENYISYSTINVDAMGDPIKTGTGKLSPKIRHTIGCSQEAELACISLCKNNSRTIGDSKEKYRTSGDYAMYLSFKHFNNQNHTLADLLDKTNLNHQGLYELLIKMNFID